MHQLQKFIGAAFIIAGLTTIYVTGQLSDSLGGAVGPTVAGAVLVLVGYCIQGWHAPTLIHAVQVESGGSKS